MLMESLTRFRQSFADLAIPKYIKAECLILTMFLSKDQESTQAPCYAIAERIKNHSAISPLTPILFLILLRRSAFFSTVVAMT
jgi:hypothetical protein